MEKTKNTIILIIEKILAKNKNRNINIVIDSEATNYYFININIFTEYEKFKILLIKRIVKKKTNFSIAR